MGFLPTPKQAFAGVFGGSKEKKAAKAETGLGLVPDPGEKHSQLKKLHGSSEEKKEAQKAARDRTRQMVGQGRDVKEEDKEAAAEAAAAAAAPGKAREAKDKSDLERRKRLLSGGRRSTNVTGGTGDVSAPTLATNILLGK